MSLLTIIGNAADNAGFNKPATIIGNTDAGAVRLLQMARREARYIAEKVNWTALVVENTFVANGTSVYALPTDYRSLVGDTLWDRSRFWEMRGALSPQEWQSYKSSTFANATIERRWRLRIPSGATAGAAVKFELDPAITSTDTSSVFVYEYVSKNWCRSTTLFQAVNVAIAVAGTGYVVGNTVTLAGGTVTTKTVVTVLAITSTGGISSAIITTPGVYTVAPSNPVAQFSTSGSGINATFTMTFAGQTQSDWVADADTGIIDEDLIELGVIWRILRRVGMAYDEEKDEYQRRLDMAIARDGGTATLDLAPSMFMLGGYDNIPDGNWPNG